MIIKNFTSYDYKCDQFYFQPIIDGLVKSWLWERFHIQDLVFIQAWSSTFCRSKIWFT